MEATVGPARRRRLLITYVILARLVLAGVLTLRLSGDGSGPLGARIPEPGEIAERSYKAPADLRVGDDAATEAVRREAIEQASIVYDFDSGRATELRDRLRAAFAAARLEQNKETVEGTEPEGAPDSVAADPAAAFAAALGEEIEVSEELSLIHI